MKVIYILPVKKLILINKINQDLDQEIKIIKKKNRN